ncbi:MAG: hypothetical protein KC468_27985 [Myxococcales bacterium]|nr:hypothetical protein [Myxococcales bacterium]
MRRFAPLLAVLLVAPALAVAAPKQPSSKKQTTRPSPAPIEPSKAAHNPCPSVTFTPEPIVVEGIYAASIAGRMTSPLKLHMNTMLQGAGLVVWGALEEGHGAEAPGLERNFFYRLDELPIPAGCVVAEERSALESVRVRAPDDVLHSGAPILDEVICELETPRCEARFKPMTVSLKPQPTRCEHAEARLGLTRTVLARVSGSAPRGALPSIDVRFETRHEAAGAVHYGVLTAVAPRKGRKLSKRSQMYRGSFTWEAGINPNDISTLYPGCAAASPIAPTDILRFTPNTFKPDLTMRPESGDGASMFATAECSWRGAGADRVLACHVSSWLKTIPLTDELR